MDASTITLPRPVHPRQGTLRKNKTGILPVLRYFARLQQYSNPCLTRVWRISTCYS